MKLCKDCRHYEAGNYASIKVSHYFATCGKSRVETIDLVSGETVINHTSPKYCHVQRMCKAEEPKTFEICGEEGRWWEAK
jgi:hypothetical protein